MALHLISRMAGAGVAPRAFAPGDDFWYTPFIRASFSGASITADTAMACSAVFACVRNISEDIGSLPLLIYQRRPDGGKNRAPFHPVYDLLHSQPNRWQTTLEWREMMQGHVLLRGNAYAQIVPGPRGAVDQLVPLHPDRVKLELAENSTVHYRVRRKNGTEYVLLDDEMFHLRGLSSDGLTGLSVIALARESVGLALSAEAYGARFFNASASPSGVLSTDQKLTPESAERMAADWQKNHAGVENAHKVVVLEEGLKWQQIGMTSEDAQFLETRVHQVQDVARWFRIPPHKIGELSRATFTNIEHQAIEYVVDTIRPWCVRWEQRIDADLIMNRAVFFAQHNVDALLRGDTQSRYAAHGMSIRDGWQNRNEVRERENMNREEGLDEFLQPVFLAPTPFTPGGGKVQNGQARLLALEAASRVIRRETAAVAKAAKRLGDNPDGWAAWVEEFYAEHGGWTAAALCIPEALARQYAEAQRDELLECGVRIAETWEERHGERLAALALGDRTPEGEQHADADA